MHINNTHICFFLLVPLKKIIQPYNILRPHQITLRRFIIKMETFFKNMNLG